MAPSIYKWRGYPAINWMTRFQINLYILVNGWKSPIKWMVKIGKSEPNVNLHSKTWLITSPPFPKNNPFFFGCRPKKRESIKPMTFIRHPGKIGFTKSWKFPASTTAPWPWASPRMRAKQFARKALWWRNLVWFLLGRLICVMAKIFQMKTRWWFQIFYSFTPTGGNDPIWLHHSFQMGSNHQLVKRCHVFSEFHIHGLMNMVFTLSVGWCFSHLYEWEMVRNHQTTIQLKNCPTKTHLLLRPKWVTNEEIFPKDELRIDDVVSFRRGFVDVDLFDVFFRKKDAVNI